MSASLREKKEYTSLFLSVFRGILMSLCILSNDTLTWRSVTVPSQRKGSFWERGSARVNSILAATCTLVTMGVVA